MTTHHIMIQPDTPFALITQGDKTTHLTGTLQKHYLLEQIGENSLSILPYSQIKEKGYTYVGDEMPILSMDIDTEESYLTSDFLKTLPEETLVGSKISSDMTDESYAAIAADIIKEIQQGEGCNFVISRQFQTQIDGCSLEKILTIYKHLVQAEPNAYMVFLYYTGEQYFIGASPEVHIKIQDGKATMNPISGTLPKKRLVELEDFIQDKKEIYELHKVLDEEMKMMARICASGGQIKGPLLKEMAQLIHTEYELKGDLTIDPIDALRISMYAPTLTGGPIENACRIIEKYETTSRRYYGTALVRKKGDDIDSCITIRTAEINEEGVATVRAGASLVIDSHPMSEAIETRTKAKGIINIIAGKQSMPVDAGEICTSSHIQGLLKARNTHLSQFLLNKQSPQQFARDTKALIIDNGDDFIYVLEHMLHSLNITTDVKKGEDIVKASLDDVQKEYSLVIIGPGPGDPNNMIELQTFVRSLFDKKIPLLGICLGHQLIATVLGYDVVRKTQSTQGTHMTIDMFGTPYLMGYYNSFAVENSEKNLALAKTLEHAYIHGQDGYMDVIKAKGLYTVQFHPESILSQYGYGCIQRMLEGVGVL